MLYEKIADLPLRIDGYELEGLEQPTPTGWTRKSTVIRLKGTGAEGLGEDVNYNGEEQTAFQEAGAHLELAGSYSLASFSAHLDGLELFPTPPGLPGNRLFRRWAFESAALDLAACQAGVSVASLLERDVRPTRFVVSTGLGSPPSTQALERVRSANPTARFKVDLSADWTTDTVAALADLGVIDTVDLKGLYRGSGFAGPPANPEQYGQVAEILPDVWIEDPELNDSTTPVLKPHRSRITWDANLHSLADILQLPFEPTCVNIKPSRFGFLSELLRVYEYCEAKGIAMYGGGQFELGPGRHHIQHLAALFHPETANDVAPTVYNSAELPEAVPTSPLAPPPERPGFGRREAGE